MKNTKRKTVDDGSHEGRVRRLVDAIPTTWLDPLLTGKDAVLGPPPWYCPDIERLLNATKERARRSLRICELGFHQSRLRWRWLNVQDRTWSPELTDAQRIKAARILAKIDAAIPRIQAQMDALEQANS